MIKPFLDKQFLLQGDTAQQLYHDYAAQMPIIDYHCHLSPEMIANDYRFKNITEAWLGGDHYKWRAMRANGVDEQYCTGNAPDQEKFVQWAKTVPYTMRNPLYHWTHLELQRYFNITDLLNESSATKIYESTSSLLQTKAFSVKNLLRKMNVKVVCTTDDPCDDLAHHIKIQQQSLDIKVLPTFRPDAAMNVDEEQKFNQYINRLETASNISISTYSDYLSALKSRHDFFAENGCKVSDHGLETVYAADFSTHDIEIVFNKIRYGIPISSEDKLKLKSALLMQFAEWDFEKGWVQQYHLGAIRNNNTRLQKLIGADVGCDSIGDFKNAANMSKFFGRLDAKEMLAKTILYNINPADNELFATMAGNYNDGKTVGKIQFGSGWWFLDQKEGITKQLDALSNMGLLSRFVGMLTDSRSFLSFPRHEYFRRILCNMLGQDIENGELPNDTEWIGAMVQNVCFNNAKNYFGWEDINQ